MNLIPFWRRDLYDEPGVICVTDFFGNTSTAIKKVRRPNVSPEGCLNRQIPAISVGTVLTVSRADNTTLDHYLNHT